MCATCSETSSTLQTPCGSTSEGFSRCLSRNGNTISRKSRECHHSRYIAFVVARPYSTILISAESDSTVITGSNMAVRAAVDIDINGS